MKIKPVVYSAKPKYPDKYEIELNKTLLNYRPKNWLKKPIVGMALITLLASSGLVGCDIFNGIGVTGGAMVAPVNYSDDEALQMIFHELQKAGYTLSDGTDNGSFTFDARIVDGDKNIDLEYVSPDDCQNKKYPDLSVYAQNYYPPEKVAEELKEAYNGSAIFYDNNQDDLEKVRAQVIDFIEWLQAIGTDL